MLYRIDYDRFLLHMIDHFTREEILHMSFLVISGSVMNSGHADNVTKCLDLFPSADVIEATHGIEDMDIIRKAYLSELNPTEPITKSSMAALYYKYILNPIELHHDVCIICAKTENKYIDVLCEFLKDEFDLEAINLNTLFTKGRVGPLYIDLDRIHDNCVDYRRKSVKALRDSMNTTREGRTKLVYKIMNKKAKIKLLDSYGITPTSTKTKDLNEMLQEVYIDEIEE